MRRKFGLNEKKKIQHLVLTVIGITKSIDFLRNFLFENLRCNITLANIYIALIYATSGAPTGGALAVAPGVQLGARLFWGPVEIYL